MAITNASRVADFGSGIGTEGAVLQVDNTNNRLGIGTTNPQAMLQVGTAVTVHGNSGIVSATTFYGSGANLTGITAGATLSAGSGAQRLVVTSLTTGTMTSAATDADLAWNSSTNTLGVTSVSATNLTGALIGNVTGNVTGDVTGSSGSAAGLTGSPDITINNLVGVAATFSGVVTCEDVTNVDSVGIITAQSLIDAQAGINVTGIITARSGTAVTFTGGLDLSNAQETVSTGSTSHYLTDSVTLELDCLNGTVFTHDLDNGNVGIVSIKNFPAVKNSFHTVTVLFTQKGSTPSAGAGNTMVANVPSGLPGGIGTHIQLTPRGVTGFATDARVGSATTVLLSQTAGDIDVVTFGIHYNGGGTGTAGNYRTLVIKAGDYRFGNIGI